MAARPHRQGCPDLSPQDLARFGRVYAVKTDLPAVDLQGIAVDHLHPAFNGLPREIGDNGNQNAGERKEGQASLRSASRAE